MRLDLLAKLAPLFKQDKRFKLAVGGRGGAKSQSIGDWFIDKASKGAKIGCFRELQNSIEDSVHSLLCAEIKRLGYDGFEVTDKAIRHRSGGEFKFRGLARNPDAVKSMAGFNYFWVEEAQAISKNSLRQLTPTLREANSEIWFSMNPMSSADPMSTRFLEPFLAELQKDGRYEDEQHLIVWCNHSDNPWFPKVLEDERLWDYEHLPRAAYDHIWLGAYNDEIEDAIIPAEWFDAAIDAHVKLGFAGKGIKVAAHDPSDKGDDPKGYALRHGSVILDCQEKITGDANDGMDWATGEAIQEQVDVFVWDADGLGASLRRQALDSLSGKKIDHVEYKGSESVDRPNDEYQAHDSTKKARTNKDTFRNKRAQYHWMLRDRFYNTYRAVVKGEYIDPEEMISLSSSIKDMAKLRSEMCRIPLKHNNGGYIQIMDKPTMARMGISSPNMAESIIMTLATPPVKTAPVTLKFESLYA